MGERIHLSELRVELETISYPVTRDDVADSLGDVMVLYADGEEPLADLVSRTPSDAFESVDELSSELLSSAPIEAIGEPGQAEGEG